MKANSYLTFNGNCREAMKFYQHCFGGELTFLTIGESPLSEQMPSQMKDLIMHATLVSEDMVLMASDIVSDKGLIKGNSVAIMLDCGSDETLRAVYGKLAEGGEQTHLPEHTFWDALFGDLTDKYIIGCYTFRKSSSLNNA